MEKPLTGPQQTALLDTLLSAAQADARSYAAQAQALVHLHHLAGREETTLSRVPQFPVLELAGTLQISLQTVTVRALEADRLHDALPLTLAALSRGDLLVPQAKTLLELTRNLSAELPARVEAALLPAAATWTTSDLRRKATSTVLQVESQLDAERGTDHVGDRLTAARARRNVTVRPEPDGMAGLWALLPAEKAVVSRHNLDELTRRATLTDAQAGITRTADQPRADLLADLPGLVLHGHTTCPSGGNSSAGAGAGAGASGTPDGIGGACLTPQPTGHSPVAILLNVLVPMDTILDRRVQPATLTGYGPINAAHVRLLRPAAQLRPLCFDHRSGQALALGDKIYPPRADRAEPAPPAGHLAGPPERRQPRRAGEDEQHRSRPAQWDEGSLRAVAREFLQPIEVTDAADEPQHDPSRRLTRLLHLRNVR